MDNHHFSWENMENPQFLWPFSIAMLNYQGNVILPTPNWLSLHHFSEGLKPPTSNRLQLNIPIEIGRTMERSTIFHGKIHYFNDHGSLSFSHPGVPDLAWMFATWLWCPIYKWAIPHVYIHICIYMILYMIWYTIYNISDIIYYLLSIIYYIFYIICNILYIIYNI